MKNDPKQSQSKCKALLEACTPRVFINNAFRITGITVDASTRDIKRRIDDLKAAEEMGDAEDEHKHAFALDPSPRLDSIRQAAQRLQDPEQRIIDEFFWFWPFELGKGQSDTALIALIDGDTSAAFNIWSEALSNDHAPASVVAKHNLAVMYQLVALDWEHLALESTLDAEQLKSIAKYWRTCFKYWEELTDNETFWSLVAERIRMLDDPRLTTGFARRMRVTLPEALDRINALLAIKYAESGKYDLAKKHIEYMIETHQGLDNIDNTISDILKPLETRVNVAVEQMVAAARKDPASAAEYAKQLIEITKEPLQIVWTLLEENHSIRTFLYEQVSDACFTCLIEYGNTTKDWPTCIDLLKKTEKLAVSDEVKAKIRDNIAVAENNYNQEQLYDICWFCKKNKAIESAKLDVPMYGDVQREWGRVLYHTISVSVPRCLDCKNAHRKSKRAVYISAVFGALIGSFWFPLGTIIGGLIGWGIGKIIGGSVRPESTASESLKAEFPDIMVLLKQDWKFGEEPSN